MPTSPEIELAWAAGFFDGEGSTFMARRGRTLRPPHMGISQNNPEVLERFYNAVGQIGTLRHYPNKKTPYSWTCQDVEGVRRVAALLWEYLGDVKREQAARTFDRYADVCALRKIPAEKCKAGHEWNEENTYTWHGKRQCRKCTAIRVRNKYTLTTAQAATLTAAGFGAYIS